MRSCWKSCFFSSFPSGVSANEALRQGWINLKQGPGAGYMLFAPPCHFLSIYPFTYKFVVVCRITQKLNPVLEEMCLLKAVTFSYKHGCLYFLCWFLVLIMFNKCRINFRFYFLWLKTQHAEIHPGEFSAFGEVCHLSFRKNEKNRHNIFDSRQRTTITRANIEICHATAKGAFH